MSQTVSISSNGRDIDRPVRSVGLATQVETMLARRLQSGEYSAGDQLPSEHELSASLGVSRATLRTALNALVRRGLVVSRQGIGNFVSEACRISNNLADAVDFNHLIADAGGRPGVVFDHAATVVPDAHVAAALRLEPGEMVHQSAKRFTADGQPVIYALTSIPVRLLSEEIAQRVEREPGCTEPLFHFFDVELGLSTEYQVASLRSLLGSACAYPSQFMAGDVAMLELDETGYTRDNQPIWHSVNWYPPGSMQFQLVRHRPHRNGR